MKITEVLGPNYSGERGGVYDHVMHGRSRMTTDPRIPTTAAVQCSGTESGFHKELMRDLLMIASASEYTLLPYLQQTFLRLYSGRPHLRNTWYSVKKIRLRLSQQIGNWE